MRKIEQDYVEIYKLQHENPDTYIGETYFNYHKKIVSLVRKTQSKSLLDFGCGKGEQYLRYQRHKDFGFMPYLYDPAVPNFSEKPDQIFDGVYSTDVLEHIPEEAIPDTIQYIYDHARKFVFLAISKNKAFAILPNGENAHCTKKPINWWIDMIHKHSNNKIYTHLLVYGKLEREEILFKNSLDIPEEY